MEEARPAACQRRLVAGLVGDLEAIGKGCVGQPALAALGGRSEEARAHGEPCGGKALFRRMKEREMVLCIEGRVAARAAVAFDEDHHHVAVDPVHEAGGAAEAVLGGGDAEGAQLRHGALGEGRPRKDEARGVGVAGPGEWQVPFARGMASLGRE